MIAQTSFNGISVALNSQVALVVQTTNPSK